MPFIDSLVVITKLDSAAVVDKEEVILSKATGKESKDGR